MPALAAIFFVTDSLRALILSQVLLSLQLPITVLLQLHLTSSRKVMGTYANEGIGKLLLWAVALVLIGLNLILIGWVFRSG